MNMDFSAFKLTVPMATSEFLDAASVETTGIVY